MVKASAILAKAKSFIGTKEVPANSNNVIFNTHYYGKPVNGASYPWCCAFLWDIFRLCNASNLFYDGKKTAYCPTLEKWAKAQGRYYLHGRVGDICFMDFGKGRASHVGIVESVGINGSYINIEGNTSASSNDNGGIVMQRTRLPKYIRGFYRPAYAPVKYTGFFPVLPPKKYFGYGDDGIEVRRLQIFLNWSGADIDVDGEFGNETYKAVKDFQKKYGLEVDGEFGVKSLKKAKAVKA
jgi:hypothetical protein